MHRAKIVNRLAALKIISKKPERPANDCSGATQNKIAVTDNWGKSSQFKGVVLVAFKCWKSNGVDILDQWTEVA